MLYVAENMVAISVMIKAHELVWEFMMVSMMVSFE